MYTIKDVTLLTMASPEPQLHMDVCVEDSHVVSIAPTGTHTPAGLVIDGAGKFLLPGLTDSHVHCINPEDFKWYVSFGITTICNYMGVARALRWRKELADGVRVGPRLITAGPIIDGTAKFLSVMEYGRSEKLLPLEDQYGDLLALDGIIEATSADKARRAVRYIKSAGYDFVKLYNNLTSEAYYAACDEADRQGILVVGHLMDFINEEKIAGKPFRICQRSVEHVAGIDDTLMEYFAQNHIAMDPTYAVEKVKLARYELNPAYQKYLALAPKAEMAEWQRVAMLRQAVYKAEPDRRPVERKGMAYYHHIMKSFYDRGGLILAGTDSGIDGLLPGVDLQIELECLAESGIPNFDVLKTATVNPAAFFLGDGTLGTIHVGGMADLLLLDGDPLRDISAVKKVSGVFCRGNYYDKAALHTLREKRQFCIYEDTPRNTLPNRQYES